VGIEPGHAVGLFSALINPTKTKESLMKKLGSAVAAILGVLALSATSASAAIVCNEEGDCWHAKQKYEYKPEHHVHVYGDDWKWADADHDKYRWREHDGPGYWRSGVWIGF
jgi:hypothetical protein